MPKLTKAKARKRLLEAEAKFKQVYMSPSITVAMGVQTADMEGVSKIVKRCLKRIQ